MSGLKWKLAILMIVCIFTGSIVFYFLGVRSKPSIDLRGGNRRISYAGDSTIKASKPGCLIGDLKNSLVYWSGRNVDSELSPTTGNRSSSNSYLQTTCTPNKHIVFVKIPKTGSTTVASVFLRYGFRNDLKVVLPATQNKLLRLKQSEYDIMRDEYDKNPHYDIMTHHSEYERKAVERLMPSDSVYAVMLREPVRRFKSAFSFFGVNKKLRLRGKNQLKTYLNTPALYKSKHSELLFNVMINYLGYSSSKTSVQNFINDIDRDFDYVLIMEYTDEGLVMLKRRFCWDIGDVIYLKIHEIKRKDYQELIKGNTDPEIPEKLRKFSEEDFLLYDYFRRKFENILHKQNADFFEEVQFLKEVNRKIAAFCSSKSDTTLDVLPCRWTRGFTIHKPYCKLMMIANRQFSVLLKSSYYKGIFNDIILPKL
ncbi:galactosylceramide sulfotransferase-like [Lingula anatina]|uniref:Galactosylceramide sulfotransferase-like n=1 Tax=Lingula anatina TaxID=7574 RepID=A0A1S3HAH9_LINAN|nr:galactosylceramide sulfotransferase-like [Lingula anatina]XP_023931954.1 galactosylceramide sulfotransferase-like [Lingula anatina]|eukprot:XP_013383080.1 galactosylceramide sulfotransferase-like [Lingula anatina]